ncbi:MAG: hypothetical protein O3C10_08360 [Chloroflexi bacterium]|nr:hypothetical protein [Chloroflexota bacterium]
MTIQLHDVDTVLDCRLLITHPTRPRVLTVRHSNAWSLPALTPLEHHVAAVRHINLSAFRLFGLRTCVRRLIRESTDDSSYHSIFRWYELEVVGELAKQRIERTAWAGRDVLDEMEFEPPADRDVTEAWLRDYEATDDGAIGPPWNQPGWFESASTWMRRRAAAAGAPPVDQPPEQHWNDDAICVLVAASDLGAIVMTASTSPKAIGSSLWASRLDGARIEPIAEDSARNWALYRVSDAPGLWS